MSRVEGCLHAGLFGGEVMDCGFQGPKLLVDGVGPRHGLEDLSERRKSLLHLGSCRDGRRCRWMWVAHLDRATRAAAEALQHKRGIGPRWSGVKRGGKAEKLTWSRKPMRFIGTGGDPMRRGPLTVSSAPVSRMKTQSGSPDES